MPLRNDPQRRYRLFGMNLTVSGTGSVLETMHGRLRYFAEATDGCPDFRFDFLTLDQGEVHQIGRPAGPGRSIGPPSEGAFRLEYFPAEDRVYGTYEDRVRLLCEPATGRTCVSIAPPESENLWVATHPMFVIALFEFLKRRRYFNIHAAGLSVDDRAVLLAGHSGSGKTTLALVLCRAGFGFLSDDYVFLTRTSSGLTVLGFPEELDVRDDIATLVPEIAPQLQTPMRAGWVKRQIHLDGDWPVQLVREAAPALLLFPQVGHVTSSRIEPLDDRDAVAELVSNIQFTRPDSAQAHLDLIGDLVRTSVCYRLTTGRDFESLATTIRTLAAAAGRRSV
jgi:hypothetical protein